MWGAHRASSRDRRGADGRAPRRLRAGRGRASVRRPFTEARRLKRTLALVLALPLLACATSNAPSNEPKVSREETHVTSFTATVAAVDQKMRVVTLVDAEGNRTTFHADEAVKNLPQVHVGDHVMGELIESLAVEVRPATADEKASPDSVAALAATAEPGQKPPGVVAARLT